MGRTSLPARCGRVVSATCYQENERGTLCSLVALVVKNSVLLVVACVSRTSVVHPVNERSEAEQFAENMEFFAGGAQGAPVSPFLLREQYSVVPTGINLTC